MDELEASDLISIQMDWHARGQNGCIFAMKAARHLSTQAWRHAIVRQGTSACAIGDYIRSAVTDANNEILSLLFPWAESAHDMKEVVEIAIAAGMYDTAFHHDRDFFVSLRYSIGNVESWVVGFGPVSSMPATRQAPIMELALRTKAKTTRIHTSLNGNLSEAHLADVDLGLTTAQIDNLLEKTRLRTAQILNHSGHRDRTHGAKARCTFSVPREA